MNGPARVFGAWLLCVASFAIPAAASQPRACTDGERLLKLGFYAHFEPVSYSADGDPGSAGFDVHRGYEADLLSALEAIDGANLSFSRRGIGLWDGIWLRPAEPEYDIVGGGITILESRTRDALGETAIVFTSGHIAFRQSLLVRAEDAERITRHRDLTGAHRVGVLAGTTGEARLLELTGITDAAGVLAAGTRVETPDGTGGPALGVLAPAALALVFARLLHIAPRLALGPEPGGAGAVGGAALLKARLAERALRRGLRLAALEAEPRREAFRGALVEAFEIAPPFLREVTVSHDGLLPADPKMNGRTPRQRRAGRTSRKGTVSPSACGRRESRLRCSPTAASRRGS